MIVEEEPLIQSIYNGQVFASNDEQLFDEDMQWFVENTPSDQNFQQATPGSSSQKARATKPQPYRKETVSFYELGFLSVFSKHLRRRVEKIILCKKHYAIIVFSFSSSQMLKVWSIVLPLFIVCLWMLLEGFFNSQPVTPDLIRTGLWEPFSLHNSFWMFQKLIFTHFVCKNNFNLVCQRNIGIFRKNTTLTFFKMSVFHHV